jgi:hypothetical protein
VILLEFAAQGFRGVAPAGGRATLRPGYNVVAADGAVLRRLLEALLFPGPKDADALPRASGGPANAALRAGLTLVGNDRVTYRLVRDFNAGAQLHRFDAEKRSFALVTQDLAEIGATMQKVVGVPSQARFATLLSLSVADLPSKQGGVSAALPGAAPRPSLTPEQARKRADALRAELEKAKVAEKLQYQLDGLQSRLFKLEEALRGGARLREQLEKATAARAELEGVAKVAESLGDPEAKLAAHARATQKRDEAVAKIAAEREAAASAEVAEAPTPFWADPRFWGGAAAGLVLAGVGAYGAPGQLRYVALLDLPAFGWSAWVALRWVAALEGRDRIARRARVVDDWERKVEAQFEKDAGAVRDAVKALGVAGPGELRDALARVTESGAAVEACRAQLAAWESSPEARNAVAEKARVEEELKAVEARLSAEAGGFVRDVRSVEAELQRVEAEASGPAPAAPAAAAAAPAPPARPAGEPLRTLGERAAAELGGSPGAALRAVSPKASQALLGLSFQRLQAIQVDDRGNVQVQSGGRPVPVLSLPPGDRDLVFLALKLALLEQTLAPGKLIAVAEDVFAGLSDGSRRFAARLLKQIAKTGQLVHATSDAAFKEAADHAAA